MGTAKGAVSPVVAAVIAAIIAGVCVGKARTLTAGPGAMIWPGGVVEVRGWVERVDVRSARRGIRLTLKPTAIGPPDQRIHLPKRISLVWRGRVLHPVRPGDHVVTRARFLAPLKPVWPGGYDPGFARWFQGIGAGGFAVTAPEPAPTAEAPSMMLILNASVEKVRAAIAGRIRAALPHANGAVAVALVTGDRSGIPDDVRDNLRAAGLAHLLAISGLHMALFAGGVFWLIRAALAANTVLALTYPIKKWAASGALMAAAGYLVLSGAGLATQRAFIMVTIMFLAIILDRPALSMRNVALAALFILLLRPESLLSVSFQLSFVAVIGLIAFYEFLQDRRSEPRSSSRTHSHLHRLAVAVGSYFWGVALTTLIAGAATAPVAAFHFNRVAVFGLLGNLLAVPLVGIVVMPAAILALLAMPFGLEGWPLALMGEGISLVIWVAERVSALPGAVRAVSQMAPWAGLLLAIGLLWLCLWRRPWRLVGAAMVLFALGSLPVSRNLPTVIVAERAQQVAVRSNAGYLVFSSSRAGKYAAERWLLKFGDLTSFAEASKRPGFACDDYGCTIALEDGREVSVVYHSSILAEECLRASVVITTLRIRGPCPSAQALITPRQLGQRGVHALTLQKVSPGDTMKTVSVQTAHQQLGVRPWTAPPERIRRFKPSQKQPSAPHKEPPKKKAPVNQPVPPLQVRI
ncbi:MAG: ComEC/Rec2 family competence protein [Pseudomonadota bacterium]